MQLKKGISVIFLIVAAVLSLILPFQALFGENGPFFLLIRRKESISMLTELSAVFFLLWGSIFYGMKKNASIQEKEEDKYRLGTLYFLIPAGIFIFFCWIHVTFLPMLVSGVYLGSILLMGDFFCGKLCKKKISCGNLADFLLGSSIVITQFCLLSAFGIGNLSVWKGISAAEGICLYAWKIKEIRSNILPWKVRRQNGNICKNRELLYVSALTALILSMILNQIGKMNISLDFDTLWYGVRSEYLVNNGKGIYENPGLVGMTYVYSKGWEVLTMPLCDLASHSYLLFFNVWLAALGLTAVYRIACFYMEEKGALLCTAMASAVPGIMNMSISAKTDIITWLLQLTMILYLLKCVKAEKEWKTEELSLAVGAYLLSLTMKPTSLVFSTAVFGMAALYFLWRLICGRTAYKKEPVSTGVKRSGGFNIKMFAAFVLFPFTALIGIWARTMLITGMPVTSVFTSIFAKIGFSMKYPFATGGLPQNWQEESELHVLFRRLYQILLSPEGKDMGHVILAWGTSLFFFLLVCIPVFRWNSDKTKRNRSRLRSFSYTLFFPFLAVNLVSLIMLYQVDGNYFMLLYTGVILFGGAAAADTTDRFLKKAAGTLLVPVVLLSVLISAESNWAWSLGYSKIELLNKGRVNHEALQKEALIRQGNAEIWNRLEQNPRTRVIAFGNHPFCLNFPCQVQSYKDITAPWGNVEIVENAQTFETYMNYAQTDYIYAEAGYIGEGSWEWSYGILKDLISDGMITDLFFENGNLLGKVRKQGEPVISDREAKENLKQFMELYRTFEQETASES